jgi:Protein of unknown function (DUF3602)
VLDIHSYIRLNTAFNYESTITLANMPSSYRITEPHPTIPSTRYIYSGRGGAGNFSHVNPKNLTAGPDASGPASRKPLPGSQAKKSQQQQQQSQQSTSSPSSDKISSAAHDNYYSAGRGGAGNMQNPYYPERPIFSFDEELERQKKIQEQMAPHYHVGRGGAGNFGAVSAPALGDRRNSQWSSESASSVDSDNSVRGGGVLGGAWNRLKGGFAK